MANSTSLWTSRSDKEFRQMSKFHSLQRRRLGLQVAAIQHEHARHMQRVRVEMGEAGSQLKQYQDDKERRARHLLSTFCKVDRRRQARHGWMTAQQRTVSSVVPSVTLDVQIGDRNAPWGWGKEGGRRRDSQQSSSSRRHSSSGSVYSVSTRTSRPALGGRFGDQTAALPPHLPGRRGLHGSSKKPPPHSGSREGGRQSTGEYSGGLNSWRTSVRDLAEKDYSGKTENDRDDFTEDEQEVELGVQDSVSGKGSANASNFMAQCESGRRSKGQVLWTETFPFVYHSVGETVCPRYRLFLKYEEYKWQCTHATHSNTLSTTTARPGPPQPRYRQSHREQSMSSHQEATRRRRHCTAAEPFWWRSVPPVLMQYMQDTT